MGRPIRKSHFGALAQSGYQITVTAVLDAGTGAETCTIISQRGTRKYKCQSLNGARTLDCFLIDGTPTAVGTAQMPVTTASGTESARTLYQYRVKTYEGNTYAWDADGRGAVVVGVVGQDGSLLVEQAVVTATVNGTTFAVSGYVLADGGKGYVGTETITVSAPDAVAAAIPAHTITAAEDDLNDTFTVAVVTGGGTGYVASPKPTVTVGVTRIGSSTGTVAAVTTVVAGAITSLAITVTGTLEVGDILDFTVTETGHKVQAVAGAMTIVNGSITAIALGTAGAGYVTAPTVTIETPAG